MVSYLASEADPDTSPFPLLPTAQTREQIDMWDENAFRRIHRDPWERKVPRKTRREHCVTSELDYPGSEYAS